MHTWYVPVYIPSVRIPVFLLAFIDYSISDQDGEFVCVGAWKTHEGWFQLTVQGPVDLLYVKTSSKILVLEFSNLGLITASSVGYSALRVPPAADTFSPHSPPRPEKEGESLLDPSSVRLLTNQKQRHTTLSLDSWHISSMHENQRIVHELKLIFKPTSAKQAFH